MVSHVTISRLEPCNGLSFEIEGCRELPVCVDLRFQIGDFPLHSGYGIGIGDKAAQWSSPTRPRLQLLGSVASIACRRNDARNEISSVWLGAVGVR
jgi:hypothetical protein